MFVESLGATLRELRLLRAMSQRQLGEMLGVTQAHISQIESGKYVPSWNVLQHYLAALDAHLYIELDEGGTYNDGSGSDTIAPRETGAGKETT